MKFILILYYYSWWFLQVYPQYTIDAKYLAPTPGPNRIEDKGCMTGFFDLTILEDIEPPSGIFLLGTIHILRNHFNWARGVKNVQKKFRKCQKEQ